MFDCIIPLGEACNITFLLHNAKIKKETSLFEWFVSPNLNDITTVLNKIANNIDTDIIKYENNHVYIGDNIKSMHYNNVNFKTIYERRRNRFLDTIISSKKILFYRFEGANNTYMKEDIDSFINLILSINRNLEDIKLVLITTTLQEIQHPSLINMVYTKHACDPYCKGEEINNFFIDSLKAVGYDIETTHNLSFTDMSDI
jgi:hypothetical protein